MAVFETWLKTDLKQPIKVKQLQGNLFSGDNNGNLIGVEVLDNGSPATLSGNVVGYIIRADGETVAVNGELVNNKASITLPSSAYVVVGQASIVIKVGTVTVCACVAYVYRTSTDTLVDPGHIIPSLEELLEKIDDCETATANANKVANLTVSAESATGSTPDAVLSETGSPAHKHITFKLVKGDTGETGAVPDITVGTVTTGEAGSNVSVTRRSGSPDTAPVFDFTIPKGDKGDTGDAFHIVKTYASISAMNADYSGTDVHIGEYVMIVSNVEDPDNAKVYIKGSQAYSFVVDMSGSAGIQGQQAYVWVRYSDDEPTQDSDMKTTPSNWIGIYSGTASTAPSTYSSYTWFKYKGEKGNTGNTGATGQDGTSYYVFIRYASAQPTQDSDMKTTADDWIGIYSGTSSTAPTTYTSYTWYKIKGETGSAANMYATTIPMSSSDNTKISEALSDKLAKPSTAGTSGQVLTSDGNGGQSWQTPSGGTVTDVQEDGTSILNNGVANIQTMTGAGSSSAGTKGLVPAPASGDNTKVLKGDGTWGDAPGLSDKADKADTVLTTTLSRGRKENTSVGAGSFAFGNDVEASGDYSVAEGTGTIAKGRSQHVFGVFNQASTSSISDWASNVLYSKGALVWKYENNIYELYRCLENNVYGSWVASKWRLLWYGRDKNVSSEFAEVVGCGVHSGVRKNARALDWKGNEYLLNTLYVHCNNDSSGGTEVATQNEIVKPITVSLDDVTNVSGSYTHTTIMATSGIVFESMKPMSIECGNPNAFRGKITVTVSDDEITLSCPEVVGTSTVSVTLMRTTPASSAMVEPAHVTSEEFDILADRIGDLDDLETTAKTDVVSAVNEILNTFAKDNSDHDFDSFTETGFYSVMFDYQNAPAYFDGMNGNLLVINGAAIIHQIVFRGSDWIYMRRYQKSSSSWSVWRSINLT